MCSHNFATNRGLYRTDWAALLSLRFRLHHRNIPQNSLELRAHFCSQNVDPIDTSSECLPTDVENNLIKRKKLDHKRPLHQLRR